MAAEPGDVGCNAHGLRALGSAGLALIALGAAAAPAAADTLLVGSEPSAQAAAARVGEPLAPGMRVVEGNAADARRLRRMDGVRWVEPNRRFYASATPNDPMFADQWALRGRHGARLPSA